MTSTAKIINDDFLDALAARFDTELRAIVPDLASWTPLYFVWESRLKFADVKFGGCVNASMDLIGRQAGAIGRWAGRGPAMLLADVKIRRELDAVDEPDPVMIRRIFRNSLRPIALHEMAHLVEREWLAPADEPPTDFVVARTAAFKVYAESSEPNTMPDHLEFHGLKFIRILIHLCHRAGGDIDNTLTKARPTARLHTPVEQYRAALGNEPARLRYLTFAEILNIKPPDAFGELFSSDMRRMIDQLIRNVTP